MDECLTLHDVAQTVELLAGVALRGPTHIIWPDIVLLPQLCPMYRLNSLFAFFYFGSATGILKHGAHAPWRFSEATRVPRRATIGESESAGTMVARESHWGAARS